MNWFFSSSKPKTPKKKEDTMSEVQQHLAAIDEIYKNSYFSLSQSLINVAWRIINSPEILSRIEAKEGEQLVQFAVSDPQNFSNEAKRIAAIVQQRPLGN
jgi:hypothetical protein